MVSNAEKYHRELLNEIKSHRRQLTKTDMKKLESYIGTNKISYNIGAETEKKIVREWISKHSDISCGDFFLLLDLLYRGKSVNEISIAGSLLRRFPEFRRILSLGKIYDWLDNLRGWAEVDSLCQSCFTAEEILARWDEWERLLLKLARDENIHRKRASLVLLTRATRESGDKRLSDLAFSNIDRLKENREILVTKAISWLLRDLTKNNRSQVQEYIRANEDTLPRIAIRETRTKLLTGKKTPPRKRT